MVEQKYYIWNSSTCSCENGKYLASITANSVIMCDDIIDAEVKLNNKAKSNGKETKTASANFIEKIKPVKCKMSKFYLHFY